MHPVRIAAAALLSIAVVAVPIEAQDAGAARSHRTPPNVALPNAAPPHAAPPHAAPPRAMVARTVPATASLLSSPAQERESSTQTRRSGWRPLNVAKWTTAAAATGLAVYGVVSNRRADERFEELEQICVDQPFRCSERLPNGSYQDVAMEARYQDVRALDRRARTALIAGQVGVGASVVLFLVDLRNSDGPRNIPYEPRTLDVTPARDGGLSMRLNLRLPSHH